AGRVAPSLGAVTARVTPVGAGGPEGLGATLPPADVAPAGAFGAWAAPPQPASRTTVRLAPRYASSRREVKREMADFIFRRSRGAGSPGESTSEHPAL